MISAQQAADDLTRILAADVPVPGDYVYLSYLMAAASTQQFVALHNNVVGTYGQQAGGILWEKARVAYAERETR